MSLSQADLEVARVRARRRLIGMAVLVGAGVVGFPWLFETQPRPMSSDIVMVQQGASAPAVSAASQKPGVQAQVKSVTKPSPGPDEPKEEFIDEPPKGSPASTRAVEHAGASKPAEAKVAAVKLAETKSGDKKAATAEGKAPTQTASAVKQAAATKPAVATAAQAKTATASDKAPSAAAVRYIVQIGAYSDATTAHEARMKAERAGLKTYTQVIGSDASKKIRVRLGPFEDKAAADKAMATLRKAGLTGGLLTL